MKPYEKFLTFGPEALSDAEILAILIRTGTKEFSATEIAEKLLKGIGEKEQTLQGLRSLTISELMEYPGARFFPAREALSREIRQNATPSSS